MALTNPITGQPLTESNSFSNPFGGTVPTVENKKIVDEDFSYKKPVSMIDTDSAISQVNKQKGYLDTNYPNSALNPPVTTPAPTTPKTPAPTTKSGKAYFTNSAGQEAEYTQEQLNDPQIQNFLSSGGYVLTKSDGVNLSENDPRANILQSNLDQSTKQVEGLINDFLSYNVDADPAFQAKAKSISAEYDRLRRNMEKTNYQRARAFETAGFRTGATQYANQVQMGIEGEELTQANNRIADISAQESEAIASARLAFETGKFNQFNQKVNALKDLREMKAKELEDYNTKIANFNKALQEEQKNLMEQQKFEFEVYKFEQEQKSKAGEGKKPMVVAPGSSIYDPSTGEFIGTAPERPSDNKPIIEKIGNDLVQWNPSTGIWDKVYSGTGTDTGASLDWAKAIRNGTADINNVPSELRSGVITALNALPPDLAKIEPLKNRISEIEGLLTSPGMKGTVGVYGVGRWTPFSPDAAEKQDFIAGVQQLVSQDTLKTLLDLKAQGGTLGALSDGERKTLQDASTKINTWAIKDENGNVTGYKISEDLFKKELNKIKDVTQSAIEKAGGNQAEPVSKIIDDYYAKNPDKRQLIDTLESTKNPKTGQFYTDEEKADLLGIPYSKEMGSGVLTPKFVQKAPEGTKGGQCGIFTRQLVDFPSGMGNAWSEKQSFVRKNGILVNEWKKNPKVGDVVFAHYDPTYGHAMVINEILPGGKFKVSESNWKGDERVSHNRIVDFNDPKIYGAVRGKLKV